MTTSGFEPTKDDAYDAVESQSTPTTENTEKASRLIEFPGVSRNSVPGWRKEVADRVREAQERRAREAAAEAELSLTHENDRSSPQLELLPQAEVPPMNPLVAAALKRIERAYVNPQPAMAHSVRQSRMAAVAYATEDAFPELAAAPLEAPMTTSPTLLDSSTDQLEQSSVVENHPVEIEKTHNLVVVPPAPAAVEPSPLRPVVTKKPRRVISDDHNSPALNYLDSVSTTIHPEDLTNRAPAWRRIFAGLIDLMTLFIPFAFALGVQGTGLTWQNIQLLSIVAGTFLVVNFLYSTINTALTGRTLGMRLMSLKVVDERTGLIPTGSQSAGRALLFNMALLTAGVLFGYALLDPDRRTAHDKFTRTAVIRT